MRSPPLGWGKEALPYNKEGGSGHAPSNLCCHSKQRSKLPSKQWWVTTPLSCYLGFDVSALESQDLHAGAQAVRRPRLTADLGAWNKGKAVGQMTALPKDGERGG